MKISICMLLAFACKLFLIATILICGGAGCAVAMDELVDVKIMMHLGRYDEAALRLKSIMLQSADRRNGNEALLLSARCEYNLLRPSRAAEIFSEIYDSAINQRNEVPSDILREYTSFAISVLNVNLLKRLIHNHGERDELNIAKAALGILTGQGHGQSLELVDGPQKGWQLALLAEAKYIYGHDRIDEIVSIDDVGESFVVSAGVKIGVGMAERASILFSLGDVNGAELLVRNELIEAGSPTRLPWSYLPQLRLARIAASKNEAILCGVLLQDADRFIAEVYGDSSPLRVPIIEGTARALLKFGKADSARLIVEKAMKMYPEFNQRLSVTLHSIELTNRDVVDRP
jgi:tetratricopeptide (TPR) repeat protein